MFAGTRNRGSFDKFADAFSAAAAGRFGSGWAWLSVAPGGGLVVDSTPNQAHAHTRTHTHTRTHAHTHTRTHARTHTHTHTQHHYLSGRTHARTHTHTHTHHFYVDAIYVGRPAAAAEGGR